MNENKKSNKNIDSETCNTLILLANWNENGE